MASKAQKAFDAVIAAGGTDEEAVAAALSKASKSEWAEILSQAVRRGILEIAHVREDGEIIYRTPEKPETDEGSLQ
jgi:hypothetical protein